MQNNVISIRITSLYWSQPAFVAYVDLSVYARLHIWFLAFKTATLGPGLRISMGPSPHQWLCAFTTAAL